MEYLMVLYVGTSIYGNWKHVKFQISLCFLINQLLECIVVCICIIMIITYAYRL